MVDMFSDSLVVVLVCCQLLLLSHSLFWLRKGYTDEAKPMSAVEVGRLWQELIWMSIEK